jgi:adenylosuccinate synthase
MKQAVIDLGFGDCGKGVTTSFLSQNKPTATVVRSNGGHQAGHTVQFKGFRHVFSQFGSGTLQGLPTFISKNCTIYPPAILKEYSLIEQYNPRLMVDPLAMITTPFDIGHNRYLEQTNKHGSVGVGFGQTIQRNEDNYKLFAQDMYHKDIFKTKLYNIATIYYSVSVPETLSVIDAFWYQCQRLIDSGFFYISSWRDVNRPYKDFIFESAQGILLDMDFGFFPHVTRSNTTSKNIIEMAPDLDEVYYVTRTYQTRHGNGPMTNEDKPIPVLDMKNGEETNKFGEYQGNFRITELDVNLLNYALQCDSNFLPPKVKKNLVITCFDQHKISIANLLDSLNTSFENVYISNGPECKSFKKY